MQKIMLIGRLGQMPETRNFESGSKVTQFSVAVSERYKKNGETIESTEWFRCEAWNKLSDICEKYLEKGKQVYIEGKMKTDTYEKDGETRKIQKVMVNTLELLGSKSDNGNATQDEKPTPSAKQASKHEEVNTLPWDNEKQVIDDDIPF